MAILSARDHPEEANQRAQSQKSSKTPLLVSEAASLVPGPAVLAPAPQHGNGQQPSPLYEQDAVFEEIRCDGDIEAPVAVQQNRDVARQGQDHGDE